MLQDDQHDRRERDHPQQGITVVGSCGQVRCPVARIDEAYGNEQSRADILEDFEAALSRVVSFAGEFRFYRFEYFHSVRSP
jgi:hypothetical protein